MIPPGRPFELDEFQRDAIRAWDDGESVLVAAPTGSGKTVVAEHAIHDAIASGGRAFYTSPIKALANQKFRDFGERFGSDQVGLLTGDLTVRGDAPIVVMTTEVLRNMLYEQRRGIDDLACVVLDEVHYLQDRDRGPVWEEVLLNLPRHIPTVSLSATVSNLEEFTAWLESVRGPTTLVLERTRPVPLTHQLAVAERGRERAEVVPLLDGKRLHAEARPFKSSGRRTGKGRRGNQGRHRNRRDGRRSRDQGGHQWVPPRRTSLVRQLARDGLAPVIWFIFSRAGCDEAVAQCLDAGLDWGGPADRRRREQILNERTSMIDDDDWYSLDLDDWAEAFSRGIASHHAGLVPAVKEAVEVAFAEGLITAVFATETLALGVNLPARTVVLERLIKFDGEDHTLLTPMQFTQLSGRAGRRGIDDAGHAVVCWSRRVPLDDLAALAASTDYPLRSAFTPNYNMVANLIRRAGRDDARSFVARSFAQFQIERTAVRAASNRRDLQRDLERSIDRASCDRGDIIAWRAAQAAGDTAGDEALGALRPGSVLASRGGLLVTSIAHRGRGVVVKAFDARGAEHTVRAGDLAAPLPVLGVATLPAGRSPSDPEVAAWAAEELAAEWHLDALGVESCPEFADHLKALDKADRLQERLRRFDQRQRARQGALEQRFDAVAEILHDHEFADNWVLTELGEVLTSVHGESEIVLADAVARGTLDGLDPPELAAVVSTIVYEERGPDRRQVRWPNHSIRRAASELDQRAKHFRRVETAAVGSPLTRAPDAGFADAAYAWATGSSLDDARPHDMTGGDFVRNMRQLIDACRQLSQLSVWAVADVAADAVLCLDHGVVRARYDLIVADDWDDDRDGDEPGSP